jgi:hypothetical protein
MGRTIKKAADKTDEEDGSFVMLIRGSMGDPWHPAVDRFTQGISP